MFPEPDAPTPEPDADASTREDHNASAPRHLLWRNVAFRTLWLGQTVSMFGSQITLYALPLLAVLTLRATPGQMGVLRALDYAPAMLVGLFAGVWVDRLRRRRVLILTDLGQALLLASLPFAAALGLLHLDLLAVVIALLSVLRIFSGAASEAFLPALVGREQLVRANSALATSSATAQVLGPGLAGGLVQLLTAPLAVVIDALSFLVSALSLLRIDVRDVAPSHPERRPHLWTEIGEGLGALRSNPLLRAFVLSSASLDIFWNALMAVYFLFVTRELRLPPAAFGLIFGIGSIGALCGSVLAGRVTRRFSLGPAIIAAQLVLGLGGLLIAVAVWLPIAALPLLTAAEAIQGCMNTIYGINSGSLMQAAIPDRLRGRVTASRHVLGLAAVTGGALLGGALGDRIGVPATMVVGACGGTIAFVWLLVSPLRALHQLPALPDKVD